MLTCKSQSRQTSWKQMKKRKLEGNCSEKGGKTQAQAELLLMRLRLWYYQVVSEGGGFAGPKPPVLTNTDVQWVRQTDNKTSTGHAYTVNSNKFRVAQISLRKLLLSISCLSSLLCWAFNILLLHWFIYNYFRALDIQQRRRPLCGLSSKENKMFPKLRTTNEKWE